MRKPNRSISGLRRMSVCYLRSRYLINTNYNFNVYLCVPRLHACLLSYPLLIASVLVSRAATVAPPPLRAPASVEYLMLCQLFSSLHLS